MHCCLGNAKNSADADPPYAKTDEHSTLITGERPIGSRYSSVEEFLNHHKSIHDDDLNLWTNPADPSHCLAEDDHELIVLLKSRDACKNSDKMQQYDRSINKIRGERKATLERWKKLLINLGFDRAADALLDVHITVQSEGPSSVSKTSRAAELHRRLVQESNIFGNSSVQAVRYQVVFDRLLDLDIAENFLHAAINQYPKALQS